MELGEIELVGVGKPQEPKEVVLPGGILDVHFKLQTSDGVSLQAQELDTHLRSLGYDVHQCASDATTGLKLPELSYQSEENTALRARIFTNNPKDGEEELLLAQVSERAGKIRVSVESYVDRKNVRIVHVRNIMSLPLNLSATKAFFDFAKSRPDVTFIFHHHDLMWEGPAASKYITPYKRIADLMESIIIPDLPNAKHVVINPISQILISEKRSIESQVIPDGFDFNRKPPPLQNGTWEEDDRLFRERFGIGQNDLVVGMMTRVSINKNIEVAIQFVASLEQCLQKNSPTLGEHKRRFGKDNRVVLLIVQKEDMKDSGQYYDQLLRYAQKLGVNVKMIGDSVVSDQAQNGDDKIPFYHAYAHTDLVVYPTEHEGFGNQLVEAVWARRPIVLFEYPVFTQYIKPYIPHFVSLGNHSTMDRSSNLDLNVINQSIIDRATYETVGLLTDPNRIKDESETNARELKKLCDIQAVAKQFLTLYTDSEPQTSGI